MTPAAAPSDFEILHFLVEGLGSLALFFIGFVLKDLRSRISRLEDHLINPRPRLEHVGRKVVGR